MVYWVDNPIEDGAYLPFSSTPSVLDLAHYLVLIHGISCQQQFRKEVMTKQKNIHYAISRLMDYFIHCMNKIR